MATLVLGGIGAAVGGVFGDPQLGFSVGVMAAGLLFPPSRKDQSGHPLADLRIHGSGYGSTIPQVFGRFRISGNIIDATDLVPHNRPGGGSGGNRNATARTYYTATVGVAVCRGPITSIDRIWAEDKLIYDVSQTPPSQFTINIHLGDEAQLVDPALAGLHPVNGTPAYRGLAYVVFDTLDCSHWGNRVPSFNFEVVSIVPYDQIILNTGNLYVYYSFDLDTGQLVDQGPNHYTLAVEAGTVTTQTPGHANEAVTFGTQPSGLRVTVGQDLNLQPAQFSVEAWFQYKGGSVSQGAGNFEYGNPSTGELAWRLGLNPNIFTATVNLSFRVFTNASGVVDVFSVATARDTLWHHLAVTYDTTGNTILYYDGVAQQTTASPVAPVTITSSASNEIEIDGGDFHWDENAFYTRVLTPLEVYNHYQGKGSTTGTILADVFNQSGLSPSQYDVSQATDYVEGFLVHTRQAARTQITELLRLYDTDLIERDGKIVALKRGSASYATVPATDLGAHVTTGPETDPPVKMTVKRLPELEIPQRVDLRYYDRTTDYEMGLQGASRYTKAGEVQEAITIQTTLVLHQDAARQKAEKELYRQWVEREQYQFSLPPSYLAVCAGDILTVPVGVSQRRTRVIALDIGLLGPLNVTAVLDDAALLTQNALGTVLVAATEVPIASTTNLIAWTCDALRDADATTVGVYLAGGAPAGQDWPGAGLYMSQDAGASYQRLANMTAPADIGVAASVLSSSSPGNVFDVVNTVDVTMTNGDPPLSTSDADVLAGSNAALLGTEVIQYATVTPLGGASYRLSRLLRGRRGTEPHVGEHQVGENFVLLNNIGVTHYALSQSLKGKQVLIKAVTVGQQLAATTAVPVRISGDELKPYSPVNVAATRNGGQDILYTWAPRARFNQEMRDGSDIAITDLPESYTVAILNGNFNSITAVTQDAVAGVVTCPFHGFSNGNTVYLSGLQGMTDLNGLLVTISNVTTNTFVLMNTPTAAMGAYISGGIAEPVIRQIAASSPAATYLASQQTTDFLAPQGSVRSVVFANGVFGIGYPAFAVV